MIINASANIVEEKGKFLLVKEGREEFRGKWNLPCGELEPGESIIDCATREGKEETGYTLWAYAWVGQYQQLKWPILGGHDLIVNVFLSKIMSGEKTIPPDLLDVDWFTIRSILLMAKRQQLVHPYVLDSIEIYRKRRNANPIPLSSIEELQQLDNLRKNIPVIPGAGYIGIYGP